MEKFVVLKMTNENGKSLEPVRWNTKYIASYRKFLPKRGMKDLNQTLVYIDHPSVEKGRMVVDNTVEELDAQVNGKVIYN